jgi:predicted RNA binding protein YcfA (HicA-like mRNA interferase family)
LFGHLAFATIALVSGWGSRGYSREAEVTFSELVRHLEANGFNLVRQKGAVRYYGKAGWPRLIRVDFHGAKQVPTGTCHAILKAAGVPKPGQRRGGDEPAEGENPEEQP